MITTAGPGSQYHVACPPDTCWPAASPLPALVMLSLLLHAALIALWPHADKDAAKALPAGPIAVRLQSDAVGGARAAVTRPTPPKSPAEHAPRPPVAPHPAHDMTHTTDKSSKPAQPNPQRQMRQPTTAAAPIVHPAWSAKTDGNQRADAVGTRAGRAVGVDHGAGLREQVRGRLQHALVAHFNYPLVARRRGWEGVVRVGLRVEPDGQLSGLRVIDSSGHALLDRAALDSLQQVGRLPDIMDWMQGRRLDMVLPIRYRLIDS